MRPTQQSNAALAAGDTLLSRCPGRECRHRRCSGHERQQCRGSNAVRTPCCRHPRSCARLTQGSRPLASARGGAVSELLIKDLIDLSHDLHDARMEPTEPLKRRTYGRHPDNRQRLGSWGGGVNQLFVQVLKLACFGRRDSRFHGSNIHRAGYRSLAIGALFVTAEMARCRMTTHSKDRHISRSSAPCRTIAPDTEPPAHQSLGPCAD